MIMVKNENKTDAANKLRNLREQLNIEHVDLYRHFILRHSSLLP